MSTLWTFLLIWGVWLITPVLVDGVETVVRLVTIRTHQVERKRRRSETIDDDGLPTMTVIVPAHNEAEVIDRCITSLKAQDYPHDKLEVIIIDDGSTDDTAERVEAHVNGTTDPSAYLLRGRAIKVGPFSGTLQLIRNGHAGKAHALNAGIVASTGDIVVNIDSDVVLAPDTVRNIAEYFVLHPEMGAATGNVEVDWDLVEERDREGNLVLDENGDLIAHKLSAFEKFLAASQFLEYLSSFDLGRRSQAITRTMYTLAGACSAFRRSIFDEGLIYRNDTVSEDTLLTFELHRRGVQIGYVDDARVHLEPVLDWDELYAQRVRWARGQMEVVGINEELVGSSEETGDFGRFAVPKMLLFDHTLAFPRLVWVPLILCFPLIGYSWRLLAIALFAIYLFYLLLEVVNAVAAYSIADRVTRRHIEKSEWALLGLPFFRFIVFHFRFSGFLMALQEKQEWTTRGPMQTARGDARQLRLRSIELIGAMLGGLAISLVRVVRAAVSVVLPIVLAAFIFMGVIEQTRRPG